MSPSPITLGLLHPLVILPPLDADQKKANLILRHELAHQAEGHLWCKLLLLLARAAHWFNPWSIRARQAARIWSWPATIGWWQAPPQSSGAPTPGPFLAALETASASTTSLSTPWQGGSSMMKQPFHNLFPPFPVGGDACCPPLRWRRCVPGGLVSCASDPRPRCPRNPQTSNPLPHLQYTACPGMLIKDAQLTTPPFCLSPTDTADASGAPAEQMIPLEDAQPLKTRGCCADRGQHSSHYQDPAPHWTRLSWWGTLPATAAVSTDPWQFAQANLGTVGADTPCYLTPEDTSVALSLRPLPGIRVLPRRRLGQSREAPLAAASVRVRSQTLSLRFHLTDAPWTSPQLTV